MSKTVEDIKAEIKEDIDELIESFKKHKKDGFTLLEISKFTFDTGSRLVEAVENVEGIPGTQKKEVVMSTVKEIYKEVNPDFPWIPEPFESWLEDVFLEKALDAFIDFIVAKYNEKKIFD